MEFLAVGLNHRTAPVEVRESLSLNRQQLPDALQALAAAGAPGVILSTCNRSEFHLLDAPDGAAADRVRRFLMDYFGLSLLDLDRYLYFKRGYAAIHHLFRVAASLDSMILGEDQIIGQVREAYAAAVQQRTAGGLLGALFQRALRVGRTVRRESGLGRHALSVSRACVEAARSVVGDLAGRNVLVVGAGDAGEVAAGALSSCGAGRITVANRTYRRAEELAASLSGQAVPFEGLPAALRDSDIVIGCTGSPGYVLPAGLIGETMTARPERPLFLIDIAVPRDIDPAAALLDNVYLSNVDDLESLTEAGRRAREQEAARAETLAAAEAQDFRQWCLDLEALPTVIELRRRAERVRADELAKTLKRLHSPLDAEELASLDAMTRAIVNKLLHDPTIFLKERKGPEELRLARQLFRLPEEPEGAADDAAEGR